MGEEQALIDEEVPPLRSRRRRVGLALALLIVVALLSLWLDRRTLASDRIATELARRGVPARYRVADLGFGRQRLVDVVIGDPADPDLAADWLETRVVYDLSGPSLAGIAAGRVRLRARLIDGRVSLGAIDRLLPPPSGKPFALPALGLKVNDARVRLETPNGVVGVRLAGEGRLDDGFSGRIAAIAPALTAGQCRIARVQMAMRLVIADTRPSLSGPIRAAGVTCGDVTVAVPRADLTVTLGETLDHWQGRARIATGAARAPGGRSATAAGTIDFAGTWGDLSGKAELAVSNVTAASMSASRLAVAGNYRIGARPSFAGRATLGGGAIAGATLARWTDWRGAGAGTPVAPIVAAWASAIARAGRDFAADAQVDVADGQMAVRQLSLATASGVRVAGAGAGLAIGRAGLRIDGRWTMRGGGLPDLRASLAQASPGAAVRGTVVVARHAAGGASLALDPVRFTASAGATRVTTRALMSGPLAGGRVDALSLPVDLDWRGDRLTVGRGCTPVSWARLEVSGLRLDPARIDLCPTNGALVRIDRGRLGGGAQVARARLTGSLGATPLQLTAERAGIRLDERDFQLAGVDARIGREGRETRLRAATLTGRLRSGVVGGFAGASGQIANVPLILSAGEGRWTLAGGALALAGALTVSDEAAAARFRPLAARAVSLRLADGRIAATGALHEPGTGERVADVRIAHLLRSGEGEATIVVPGIAFREGFQPELLTPLTFGVVADVRGTVRGDARIAWGPGGVTSTGRFGTDALDLAAAFGPVTGIATTLSFTDLLGMRTAPGQVATVRSVNPGIPVENGRVAYRIAGPTLVEVEGAQWPFAGGALTLEPTLLDFSRERERRMTFRVAGASAGAFLQQFDFDNLDATGTFDGVLPMIFDQSGGRIADGRLLMRQGGGTLAYVGTLSQQELGVWGDLAFQALKSLRYRSLGVTLNGPLAGEMVTDVRFAGIAQGKGARSNFLIRRLQRLPFVFNIRIRAPFRGLIDSAQSFYDPRRLIQRNLPALLDQQNKTAVPPAVQPPATGVQR